MRQEPTQIKGGAWASLTPASEGNDRQLRQSAEIDADAIVEVLNLLAKISRHSSTDANTLVQAGRVLERCHAAATDAEAKLKFALFSEDDD